MSAFKTRLVLESDSGEGMAWTVREPFIYSSDHLRMHIIVPAGFQTDLASVPRLPVVYLLTGATGNEAAVVHDWLYSTQPCARADADEVFYEACIVAGMPRWRAWLMWAGVRAGGRSHWADRPAS